jgi:Rrf2 family protein
MDIPKRVDYAVRGIYCLAKAGRPLFVHEIAALESVPQASLAKIFQVLAQHGLLSSVRGKWGGFQLALPPEKITLARIIEAVEGNFVPERCPSIEDRCPRKSNCYFFDAWRDVVGQTFRALESVSVRDLMDAEQRRAEPNRAHAACASEANEHDEQNQRH